MVIEFVDMNKHLNMWATYPKGKSSIQLYELFDKESHGSNRFRRKQGKNPIRGFMNE